MLFQPFIRLIILALWAVPVFARMVAVTMFLAVGAVIDLAAESFGAAAFDVLHCPPMRRQHPIGEFGSVVGAVEAEDVRDLDHQSRAKGLDYIRQLSTNRLLSARGPVNMPVRRA